MNSVRSHRPSQALGVDVHQVKEMARKLAASLEILAEQVPSAEATVDVRERVRAAYRSRRMREEQFPRGWFGEPAWDILLDLLLADLEGRQVSVADACIASSVPMTTALRWIGNMIKSGIVIRTADAKDLRRARLELSAEAKTKLVDLFQNPSFLGL